VKFLKVLVLVFGAAGLVSLFLPLSEGGESLYALLNAADRAQLIIMLSGFGVPTALAILGLVKPPFAAWQGIASLACFALMAVKTHVWDILGDFSSGPTSTKLMIGAILGGVLVSLVAVAKPERA
jgi:hypothetical protein